MPESTEEGIQAALVAAIQGIATTELGFDEADGNVKSYLLEHEAQELDTSYLMANVDGVKKVRAWGVWVTGDDDWYTTGALTKRNYQIRIVGYYEHGVNGEGANAITQHARKIREAIKAMTTTLGGRVDRTIDTAPLSVVTLRNVNPSIGSILVGTMLITADKRHPDF